MNSRQIIEKMKGVDLRVYPLFVVLARNSWYMKTTKRDEQMIADLRNELEPRIVVADCLVFNQKDYRSFQERVFA